MQIPSFDDSLSDFRQFLKSQGHPETVAWVFREDVFFRDRATCLVRYPPPAENGELVRKVFNEGRAAGLVELKAFAVSDEVSIASVWFPRKPEEEVQGWSMGMKLAIVEPPASSEFVTSKMRWWWISRSLRFRRYQRDEWFIPTRAWAAV
jgi:hypothetical protein